MDKAIKVITPLIKRSTSYKMIIPENVEMKIRHMCNRIPNLEWSGVLFYTYDGTFEKNDLIITCVDFLVMDIGSSTYTSFETSPDMAAYMADHLELIHCKTGLIH